MTWLDGLGGTSQGSFFLPSSWVDLQKPPGTTKQLLASNWTAPYFTLSFVIYSPNLVWLLIALSVWFIFPYEYDAAKSGFSFHWIFKRLLIAIFVTFSYTGFWHVSLYYFQWGKRPFKSNRKYKWSKLFHNLTFCFLGCLQWTVWESIFIYCYATKRISFITDEEIYGSTKGLLNFVAWFFLVPLYRDLHFYFAHRMLHFRSLYKYVHSVHHRNTDIEPFAGLSMHPVEHLYYFSCVAPALYCYAPPFAFFWNGIHLLLSPGAAHSGYEDHFQADQFHYLHHRYFECNYGTSAIPFDLWFGTFCDKLKGSKNSNSEKEADIADAKANLFSTASTSSDYLLYASAIIGIFGTFIAIVLNGGCESIFPLMEKLLFVIGCQETCSERVMNMAVPFLPHLVGLLLAVGPVLVSMLLIYAYSSKADRRKPFKLFLYPFHEEAIFGPMGLHLVMGILLCVIPVYHVVITLLNPPAYI